MLISPPRFTQSWHHQHLLTANGFLLSKCQSPLCLRKRHVSIIHCCLHHSWGRNGVYRNHLRIVEAVSLLYHVRTSLHLIHTELPCRVVADLFLHMQGKKSSRFTLLFAILSLPLEVYYIEVIVDLGHQLSKHHVKLRSMSTSLPHRPKEAHKSVLHPAKTFTDIPLHNRPMVNGFY